MMNRQGLDRVLSDAVTSRALPGVVAIAATDKDVV